MCVLKKGEVVEVREGRGGGRAGRKGGGEKGVGEGGRMGGEPNAAAITTIVGLV